ncbi:MAG: hypothetical protein FWF46_05885 [Oscillospiraceae bacterium]|nr:hypothetical protein [Oscillospiraceae bacterium]
MPNHIHAIIEIKKAGAIVVLNNCSAGRTMFAPTLSSIVKQLPEIC